MVIESNSSEETFAFGETLGRGAAPGDVFALLGDLGTGKTVLTQGMARGLDLQEWIGSPTFTVLQEHQGGRLPFYHFDVYRIGEPEEMDEIGFDDYIYGDGVTMIEWADRIEELLPKRYTRITIARDPDKGADYRRIAVEEIG